jgi:hypothetical protein
LIKRLLVLLLLAVPLYAQTNESVAPNALTEDSGSWRDTESSGTRGVVTIDGTGNSACTSSGTPYACCSGPGAGSCTDTWNTTFGLDGICEDTTGNTTTYTLKVDFATPTDTPTSTTDAQAIRIHWYKANALCANNVQKADPTFSARVYDGSTEYSTGFPSATTCSAGGTAGSYTFTYNGGSDGSEVYVDFDAETNGSTGSNQRDCALDYIEWYAQVGTVTDDGLMVVRHEVVKPKRINWIRTK